MKKALQAAAFLLFIAFTIPFALMPLVLSKKAGRGAGAILYALWKSRRIIAIENIKNSLVDFKDKNGIPLPPKTIALESFKNLGESIAELIKIYYGMQKKVLKSVRVEGIERLKRRDKGIILITGHTGNWELLALASTSNVGNIGVVARPFGNPYINNFIEKARSKNGNYPIYKKGALRKILSALKDKGIVGILMDQAVVEAEGLLIDFLGRPAWTTKTPAIIANRTKAAVHPLFIHREGSGHIIKIYPEVQITGDELKDTITLSAYIEDYIKENPTEWLWIHKRWKRTEGQGKSAEVK